MDFLNRVWLWALLPLLVLAAALILYGNIQRQKALKEFLAGGARLVFSPGKRALRHWLLLIAVFCTAVAAARPWWGEKPIEVSTAGSDVLVVFDVSKSMLAEDLAPSRLEHAKWLLSELIRKNPEARFGIIAFAGRAFFSCPLTSDRVTLEQCIAELNPDLIPIGGTNLAAALETAVKALDAAAGQNRTILLFTDGEELYGSVEKELAKLKDAKIELLIAGFGDPSAPALIPEPDGKGGKHFKRDAKGELVRTLLNEKLLRSLAQTTGGMYLTSTAVNTGLEQLSRRIQSLDNESERNVKRTLPIDRFMLFLFPGALAFFLYLWISEVPLARKFRKVPLLFLAFFLAMGSNAGEDAVPPEARLPEAPAAEQSAPELSPDAQYNQSRDLQLAGKLDEAAQGYEKVIQSTDSVEALHLSTHNLGVIAHTKARAAMTQSAQTAQNGSIDQALQSVSSAEKALDQAEEYYSEALVAAAGAASPSAVQADTATAQQLLLQDREALEKLKKQLEELKKKQQEAQQKTQQAQKQNQQQQKQDKKQDQQQGQQGEQQKQQGQQSEQQKQEQGQQQQGQQSEQQKQNQQQQGQQGQDQQSAQDALKQAQQAVDDLKKQADQMNQKETQNQAQKAADALKDAAQKQAKQDFKGAQKDLDRAAEELGKANQGEQSDPKENASKQDRQKGEKGEKPENSEANKAQKDGEKGEAKLPQPTEPDKQDKEKTDGQQADAMLDLMKQDEKLLRDAIKSNRNRGIKPVEKDW